MSTGTRLTNGDHTATVSRLSNHEGDSGEAVPSGGNVDKQNIDSWVVLFTRTGSEHLLTNILSAKLDTDKYKPFVPRREISFRRKGITTTEHKILFPGYVFLQTYIEKDTIAEGLRPELYKITGLQIPCSLLYYGDNKRDVAIRQEERSEWERLFSPGFCVETSVGYMVGDEITVTAGALCGFEGRIRKINRHKREASVEMNMLGAKREVWLPLEIVERR